VSGIVGSKFNIRGSGLVGSLGTDGQHLLSSGAGVTNVFETVAGGGGKVLKVSKEKITNNGISSVTSSYISFGADYGFDLTYTSGSMIHVTTAGMMQSNSYGYVATHAAHSAFKWMRTTGSIPAEGAAIGGSDDMVMYFEWGLENMFNVANKDFGIYGSLNCDFHDTPSGTACKYYMAGTSNRATTRMSIYGQPSQPFYITAVEYDIS